MIRSAFSSTFILLFILCFSSSFGQSPEISILRSTLSNCGSNQSPNYHGRTFILKQSIGQASISGTKSNNSIRILQGYIQPQLNKTNTKVEIEELDVEVKKISNTDNYIITVNENLNPIRIDVYNTLGQKKFSQNTDPYEETYINLGSYSKGCYILNVQTNQKSFSTKLIKK